MARTLIQKMNEKALLRSLMLFTVWTIILGAITAAIGLMGKQKMEKWTKALNVAPPEFCRQNPGDEDCEAQGGQVFELFLVPDNYSPMQLGAGISIYNVVVAAFGVYAVKSMSVGFVYGYKVLQSLGVIGCIQICLITGGTWVCIAGYNIPEFKSACKTFLRGQVQIVVGAQSAAASALAATKEQYNTVMEKFLNESKVTELVDWSVFECDDSSWCTCVYGRVCASELCDTRACKSNVSSGQCDIAECGVYPRHQDEALECIESRFGWWLFTFTGLCSLVGLMGFVGSILGHLVTRKLKDPERIKGVMRKDMGAA